MVDYKKMYFELFNAVTLAIEQLEDAQRSAEEAYLGGGDVNLYLVAKDEKQGE